MKVKKMNIQQRDGFTAIQMFPRKIHGLVRCYHEHGLYYTINRLLTHLHISSERDYAFYSALPPEKYPRELKRWYRNTTGEKLNLNNPKTFNEKIQWLKLYDSTPLKTRLADKYLVRDWVKEKIGEEHLVPLLGVWDSFDEIDFDKLPDQFVLKANHGSGWNIIVKDKSIFDKEEAKGKFDQWMHTNYAFVAGFELHYMSVPPKIMAEEYIEDLSTEYQYWCFNGQPKFISCIQEPHGKNEKASYSLDFKLLDFITSAPAKPDGFEKPDFLDDMDSSTHLLCQSFTFVRVDYLSDGNHYYFGEITFTPASGLVGWKPEEYDKIIGEWMQLPKTTLIRSALLYGC